MLKEADVFVEGDDFTVEALGLLRGPDDQWDEKAFQNCAWSVTLGKHICIQIRIVSVNGKVVCFFWLISIIVNWTEIELYIRPHSTNKKVL
jgi:hypothetical protein